MKLNPKKINFVSVPRCASTSIHTALFGKIPGETNHKSIRKTKDDRHSFAIIRDPLDRLISWFKYHSLPQYEAVPGDIYKGSFVDWVRKGCPHHWTDEFCAELGISNPLFQFEFITDQDQKTILVDQLIAFDDLDEGLRIADFDLIHLDVINFSPQRKHALLNRKTIEHVYKVWEKDYKIYNSI